MYTILAKKKKWIAKLKNYQFYAKHFSSKENHMVDYLLCYSVKELLQMLEEDDRRPKFVEVVFYIKKEIWMSIWLKTPMKGSLQIVFKKANEQESIIVVKKEVNEKIKLKVTQL